MLKSKSENFFKQILKLHEYEIVLFLYLILRFFVKRYFESADFFTAYPIWGNGVVLNTALGSIVMIMACLALAFFFGKVIRANGEENEKPVLILVALFLACPSALPFLFTSSGASGTYLLYSFAFFLFAVFLSEKKYVKWLIPVICALLFIPAKYSSAVFLSVFFRGSGMYIPLLLVWLFLNCVNSNKQPANKKGMINKNKTDRLEKEDFYLFGLSFIIIVGAYTFLYSRKLSGGLSGFSQEIDSKLLVCLLVSLPALITVLSVLIPAAKTEFPRTILLLPILMLPLFNGRYYTEWIPFTVILFFLLAFYLILHKNSKILSAVNATYEFFLRHKLLLMFALISTSMLSNVNSITTNPIGSFFFSIPY